MQRSSAATRHGPALSAGTAAPYVPPELPRVTTTAGPANDACRAAAHVLRVLLVEDSPLLVQRIAELVADLPGVEIARTAASEAEALTLLADGRHRCGDPRPATSHRQRLRHPARACTVARRSPSVVVFTNFAHHGLPRHCPRARSDATSSTNHVTTIACRPSCRSCRTSSIERGGHARLACAEFAGFGTPRLKFLPTGRAFS